MERIEQGDILRISGIRFPSIVVSNNYFNRTGNVVVCPILKMAEEGPLHLRLDTEQISGYILCEQVRYLNLAGRHYSKMDSAEFFFVMDMSDAITGLFDYQTIM